MISTFTLTGDQTFDEAFVTGNDIIFRSSEAADTGTITVWGTRSAGDKYGDTMASLSAGGKVEKHTSITWSAVNLVTIPAAYTGVLSAYVGNGSKAEGDIRVDSAPSADDTISVGLAGFVITGTFKASVSGADEIKIDGTTNTAKNIASWINDAAGSLGTSEGTDYNASAANPYAVASVETDGVVTLTDNLATNRFLDWSVTQGTGSTLTIRTPVGGVDGTKLGELTVGNTSFTDEDGITFDTADLATESLPESLTGNSDSILVGGRFSLSLRCGTVAGGDASFKYQTSVDGTNWRDGDTAIAALASDQDQVVTPPELAEYVRLVITANTLTDGIELDANLVS